MILLTKGTGHKITLTTDAAGDIEIDLAYVDKTGTGPSSYSFAGAGEPLASITTATTTDILLGAASTERALRRLSAYNNHASQAVTCTFAITDATDTVTLAKVVLAAGESFLIDAAGCITHYDANEGAYVGIGPIATQAEMEAGTSLTAVVTPARQQFHPSACKAWLRCGVAGDLTSNYNITNVTDTGTGVVGITIATDFSSATGYCCVATVEATATTWAVANTREVHIRNATLAAGTVSLDCIDNTATTSLVKDPSSWHAAFFGDQ